MKSQGRGLESTQSYQPRIAILRAKKLLRPRGELTVESVEDLAYRSHVAIRFRNWWSHCPNRDRVTLWSQVPTEQSDAGRSTSIDHIPWAVPP